jgi:hypothetical protein
MIRRWSWLPSLALLPFLLAQAPVEKPAASKTKNERLLEIYQADAEGYTMYRDASRREKVELRHEPVYLWTNPLRQGGQYGAVYLWTCKGRAEAIGSIFSATGNAGDHQREVWHEFHSLSHTILDVSHPGTNSWTPEGPGATFKPIADAPTPAATPAARLLQLRTLSREFSGHTVDREETRWELRLLPRPFYRYESTDPDIVDGAVFAFVTSAGTDPEMILVLEARRPTPSTAPVWQFGVARFTDLDLWVSHKGVQVYSIPRIVHGLTRQDEKHRYRLFGDRTVPIDDDDVSAKSTGAATQPTSTPKRGEP